MPQSSASQRALVSQFEAGKSEAGEEADVSIRAPQLNDRLADASPEAIIEAALAEVGPGKLALVSSFGAESAVMLAVAAAVDPSIPVLLVDTGYLFPETLAYRDELSRLFGLTDVRSLGPEPSETEREDPEGDLWARDVERCCALRKARPLARALGQFDAWANGRKRYQAATRSSIPLVEAEGGRLKFNPLASLDREELAARFKTLNLPQHPLEKHGFASIGCMQCTSRVKPGEDPRAGRWRGKAKTECGIHGVVLDFSAGQ
jgi:phosphoadenosine phosphosulfate reductase